MHLLGWGFNIFIFLYLHIHIPNDLLTPTTELVLDRRNVPPTARALGIPGREYRGCALDTTTTDLDLVLVLPGGLAIDSRVEFDRRNHEHGVQLLRVPVEHRLHRRSLVGHGQDDGALQRLAQDLVRASPFEAGLNGGMDRHEDRDVVADSVEVQSNTAGVDEGLIVELLQGMKSRTAGIIWSVTCHEPCKEEMQREDKVLTSPV